MNRQSLFLLIFTTATCASAYFNPFNPYWDPSFDYFKLRGDKIEQIIKNVNSKPDSTWTAGHNFDGNYEELNMKNLLGTAEANSEDGHDLDIVDIACPRRRIGDGLCSHHDEDEHNHTKEFDAREAWPSCPEISKVRNQGKCASDWVLAPTSVIADRWCIAKNSTEHFEVSAHEPLSCCKNCGWGCEKGYPQMVYKQFVTEGLVSGGDYNSSEGCQPYEIEPCENYKQCLRGKIGETPTCKPYCYNKNFNGNYREDMKRGYKAFHLTCQCEAGDEIKKRGPISGTMVVYEDFLTYKSGIYKHVHGEKLGKLTVKLIGFNDNYEPNYWIAVNSWGPKWGEGGIFKIVRGQSECLIDNGLNGVWIDEVHE